MGFENDLGKAIAFGCLIIVVGWVIAIGGICWAIFSHGDPTARVVVCGVCSLLLGTLLLGKIFT